MIKMPKKEGWTVLTEIFNIDYFDPPSQKKVLAYYRKKLPKRKFKAVPFKNVNIGFRIMEKRK
tara:strand:+ start:5512 stop:5700 length:189 start_codon:yes stop_codon:yes gene_type:complete